MNVSAASFEQLALQQPEAGWELDRGRPRRKPVMTMRHNRAIRGLMVQLAAQLAYAEHAISPNLAHLTLPSGSSYVPDLCVIPRALERQQPAGPGRLEAYAEPLPLVVEVWPPSTGGYDVEIKLDGYQQRGDVEIWLVYPYDRTVTAWRREPDGGYGSALFRGGHVRLTALPAVTIDIDAVFA